MSYPIYFRYYDASSENGFSQICFDMKDTPKEALAVLKHPPSEVAAKLVPHTALVVTENTEGRAYDPRERPKAFGKVIDYRKKTPAIEIMRLSQTIVKHMDRFGSEKLLQAHDDLRPYVKVYDKNLAIFWRDATMVDKLGALLPAISEPVAMHACCECLRYSLDRQRERSEKFYKQLMGVVDAWDQYAASWVKTDFEFAKRISADLDVTTFKWPFLELAIGVSLFVEQDYGYIPLRAFYSIEVIDPESNVPDYKNRDEISKVLKRNVTFLEIIEPYLLSE